MDVQTDLELEEAPDGGVVEEGRVLQEGGAPVLDAEERGQEGWGGGGWMDGWGSGRMVLLKRAGGWERRRVGVGVGGGVDGCERWKERCGVVSS